MQRTRSIPYQRCRLVCGMLLSLCFRPIRYLFPGWWAPLPLVHTLVYDHQRGLFVVTLTDNTVYEGNHTTYYHACTGRLASDDLTLRILTALFQHQPEDVPCDAL